MASRMLTPLFNLDKALARRLERDDRETQQSSAFGTFIYLWLVGVALRAMVVEGF